jgi:hypothetical protein
MEFSSFGDLFNFLFNFIAVIGLLAIWDLIWKGFALWKAARNNHVAWYVCIVIFNTVGILPIIYILLNRNKQNEVVEI